jgi:gliding motility-associated-like protein
VQVYYAFNLLACCDKTIQPGGADTINADSAQHYKWSPNSSLNCDTCRTVIASPSVTTTYTVIGTDAGGCTTEKEITVTVEINCKDFDVPNVFTPGITGINAQFFITTENLDKYSITIYDRWGKEMYKSSDQNQAWNGNTEAGAQAPDGVYYYTINSTCQGNTYNKHGFVQLIR